MIIKNYNCSQQELYSICRLGWQSCLRYIEAFRQFSPRYNVAFVALQQQLIRETENLPDYQARHAQSEVLHVQLVQQAKISVSNWKRLKRYISSAWPPPMLKPMLEAAGQTHYRKASRKYWESMNGLLTSGNNFIKVHLQQLIADNNMPSAFPATFENAATAFQKLHQDFLKSEAGILIQTENKIKANNQIHASLMAMLLDGQEIFKNEDAIKMQFVFSTITRLLKNGKHKTKEVI